MLKHWFCGLSLLLISPVLLAATYYDSVDKVRFTLPEGWKVRASTTGKQRMLRIIPPKADQRERAAINVSIQVRKLGKQENLPRLAQQLRRAQGDREAANFVRINQHGQRLVAEYRDGHFVSNRLWIVRHNLQVMLLGDKKQLVQAHCTANASEFKTYRRQMESICLSLELLKR